MQQPTQPPSHSQWKKRIRRLIWIRTMKTCVRLALLACVVEFIAALFRSPCFQVKSVRVTGVRTLRKEQVQFYAQGLIGQPAILPPKGAARRRLMALPEIESVQFNRLPSRRMTVRVTERQPCFLLEAKQGSGFRVQGSEDMGSGFWVLGSGEQTPKPKTQNPKPALWVVDRHGVVFRRAYGRAPHLALVQVMADREWRLGDRLTPEDTDRIRKALAVVQRAGLPSPERFYYHDGYLSLRLADRTLVRLGNDEWERKLRRARRAFAFLRKTGQAAEYIDLTSLEVPTWKAKKVSL